MRYSFTTQRLIVKEWHSFEPQELQHTQLTDIVQSILIPQITADFPIMWRGEYDKKRARFWIKERDAEAITLLALDKRSKNAIGFLHFFSVGKKKEAKQLRLGYALAINSWNKGYASELLEGFVSWCGDNNIATLLAGVNPKNSASMRVLQKNGFTIDGLDANGIDYLFGLKLQRGKLTENLKSFTPRLHSY